MESYSRGVRVQVYFGETDHVGKTPRYQAMLEYLRREGAAGATVARGVAGFGANSRIHTAAILRLSLDLPMVLTWVDAPGRVERLLPGLQAIAGSGIVTVEEIRIAAYGGRRLEQLRFDLQVQDVMVRPAISVRGDETTRTAVDRLIGQQFRALPVVDAEGRVVGVVSSGDLVERGGLGARLELLSAMTEPVRESFIDRMPERAVREVMTPSPATVRVTDSVAMATHVMADRRIKRLPVVDPDGRLAGVLSRSDVLRAVGETFPRDPAVTDHPGAQTVAELMRGEVPKVRADAGLAELLDAVVSTRLNRAVVVDERDRVVGVVTDADVLRSVDPAADAGVVGALMRTVGRPPSGTARAASLVSRPPRTVPPHTPIADAARIMTGSRTKVLCVVDDEDRLLGIVDRADLLHAAGDALRQLAATGAEVDDD